MISTLIDNLQRRRDWRSLSSTSREQYARDRAGQLNDDPGIDKAVAATIEWLCAAQQHSSTADGGVARHYSITQGWGPSYPETTGYIVPTMIEHARETNRPDLHKSARDMLDWLVRIQLSDGAFQGGTITDTPVVGVTFNTGQILIGLVAGASEYGEPYVTAMRRAADWLAGCMDSDGCWRQNQSPFARAGEKTYETHTAWGLLEAARSGGDEKYGEAALKNIRWALGKQQSNGWFADCCLTDPAKPLTHTLGYALRGIIEGFLYSGDDQLLRSAELSAKGMMSALRADGSIPGRLDKNWNGVVGWVCLTGSVQIAHCWLLLYQQTGNPDYLEAARLANKHVRRTIDFSGSEETHGAVRGSFPIYGSYGQFQYLNWAAKFFVDSNFLEKSVLESSA